MPGTAGPVAKSDRMPTRAAGVEAGEGTRGESEHGQKHEERGSASLPATKPVGGCEELSGSQPAPRESGFRTGGCSLEVRLASGPSGLRLRAGPRTHPFRPGLRAAPGTPPRRIGTQTGSGCLLPYCSGRLPDPWARKAGGPTLPVRSKSGGSCRKRGCRNSGGVAACRRKSAGELHSGDVRHTACSEGPLDAPGPEAKRKRCLVGSRMRRGCHERA